PSPARPRRSAPPRRHPDGAVRAAGGRISDHLNSSHPPTDAKSDTPPMPYLASEDDPAKATTFFGGQHRVLQTPLVGWSLLCTSFPCTESALVHFAPATPRVVGLSVGRIQPPNGCTVHWPILPTMTPRLTTTSWPFLPSFSPFHVPHL